MHVKLTLPPPQKKKGSSDGVSVINLKIPLLNIFLKCFTVPYKWWLSKLVYP